MTFLGKVMRLVERKALISGVLSQIVLILPKSSNKVFISFYKIACWLFSIAIVFVLRLKQDFEKYYLVAKEKRGGCA